MTEMLPSNTRILIIDDEPGLLILLTKMLTRIGAETKTALNGADGLALLDTEPFDLLILDLMLPDMDGFDILKQIRQNPAFDILPVLILSARADPEDISKGLELGADGYLTKPYLPNTLTGRVRTLLAQGHRQT